MKIYPISIPGTAGKQRDTRYSVEVNKTRDRFVLKYEGTVIAAVRSLGHATLRATNHRLMLNGQEPIVEVRPGDPVTS
jgi:hypothetical protein